MVDHMSYLCSGTDNKTGEEIYIVRRELEDGKSVFQEINAETHEVLIADLVKYLSEEVAMDIKELSIQEARDLLSSTHKKYQPTGLFYVIEDGVYVAIDNSTGNAWTEEFQTLDQCMEFLNGGLNNET